MNLSDAFGGNSFASLYNDGATSKVTEASSATVVLDVQEKGFFSISELNFSNSSSLEITIDGKSFSGSTSSIFGSLGAYYEINVGVPSITPLIPYTKSLKVEILTYTSGTLTINRTS